MQKINVKIPVECSQFGSENPRIQKGTHPSQKYDFKSHLNFCNPLGHCKGLSTEWLRMMQRVSHAACREEKDKIKNEHIGSLRSLQKNYQIFYLLFSDPLKGDFFKKIQTLQRKNICILKENFYDENLGRASHIIFSKSKNEFPNEALKIFLIARTENQEYIFDIMTSSNHAMGIVWKINEKDKTFDVSFLEPNTRFLVLKKSISLLKLDRYKEILSTENRSVDQESEMEVLYDSIQADFSDILGKMKHFSEEYSLEEPILTHTLYFGDQTKLDSQFETKISVPENLSSFSVNEINNLIVELSSIGANSFLVDIFPMCANINEIFTAIQNCYPLYMAAENGHTETVKILLALGANKNAISNNEATPLCVAAQNGHTDIVKLLLEHNADANLAIADDGITPLWMAAQNGHTDIAKLLLAHGADANLSDTNNTTPLHTASLNGHVEVVKLLLTYNADVNAVYQYSVDDKITPLLFAIKTGQIEIIELLVAAHANVNLGTRGGDTPLLNAMLENEDKYRKIVKILLHAGADPNVKSAPPFEKTPLRIALANKDIELIEFLINAGVNIDVREKINILMQAAKHDCISIFKALLTHSENPDNGKDETLLSKAMSNIKKEIGKKIKHTKIIEILIDSGIDHHFIGTKIESLLHFAVEKNDVELVEYLLSHGAEVDQLSEYNKTPLMQAAEYGWIEIVEILLASGTNPNLTNENGETALFLAAANDRADVVRMLLKANADPRIRRSDGMTMLRIVLENGFDSVEKVVDEFKECDYIE